MMAFPSGRPMAAASSGFPNREGALQNLSKAGERRRAGGVAALRQTIVTLPTVGRRMADFILYTRGDQENRHDVWVLPLEGDRKPFLFLQTPFVEGSARFSPDGRWIAYRSNESGGTKCTCRRFLAPGGKWQISTNGGQQP